MHFSLRTLVLVPATLLALTIAPRANAADDGFLQIDSIPGDSTDAVFRNAITVRSFQFGGTNSASPAVGGTMTGKSAMAGFTITKHIDKASPLLFKALASSQVLPKVTFSLRKVGADPKVVYKVTLEQAVPTAVKQAENLSDAAGSFEEVTFTYSRISIEFPVYNADGRVNPSLTVKAGWDVAAAKTFTPTS